jgi:mycofactocin precursor
MENEEIVATIDADATGLEVDDGIEEELLIEEISIDGMCGVY